MSKPSFLKAIKFISEHSDSRVEYRRNLKNCLLRIVEREVASGAKLSTLITKLLTNVNIIQHTTGHSLSYEQLDYVKVVREVVDYLIDHSDYHRTLEYYVESMPSDPEYNSDPDEKKGNGVRRRKY